MKEGSTTARASCESVRHGSRFPHMSQVMSMILRTLQTIHGHHDTYEIQVMIAELYRRNRSRLYYYESLCNTMFIELYTSQVLTKYKPDTRYTYYYHYQGSKNKGYVTKVLHPPRMRYSLVPSCNVLRQVIVCYPTTPLG